jgi:hypothetical protein
MDRVLHQDLEVIPVLGQQLELEAIGNRIHRPRLRLRLETAHDEPADFFLVVEIPVGVAYDRHVGRNTLDRLGDQVEVLRRIERHVDSGEASERAGPLPPAVDERFTGDRSFVIL